MKKCMTSLTRQKLMIFFCWNKQDNNEQVSNTITEDYGRDEAEHGEPEENSGTNDLQKGCKFVTIWHLKWAQEYSNSYAETELVGADDMSTMVLQLKLLMEAQNYEVKESILYQDNKITIIWCTMVRRFLARGLGPLSFIIYFWQIKLRRGFDNRVFAH